MGPHPDRYMRNLIPSGPLQHRQARSALVRDRGRVHVLRVEVGGPRAVGGRFGGRAAHRLVVGAHFALVAALAALVQKSSTVLSVT